MDPAASGRIKRARTLVKELLGADGLAAVRVPLVPPGDTSAKTLLKRCLCKQVFVLEGAVSGQILLGIRSWRTEYCKRKDTKAYRMRCATSALASFELSRVTAEKLLYGMVLQIGAPWYSCAISQALEFR